MADCKIENVAGDRLLNEIRDYKANGTPSTDYWSQTLLGYLNFVRLGRETLSMPVVEELISYGASLHAADYNGNGITAVHYAAMLNNKALIQLFMKHGVDPNHKDLQGISAFNIAQNNHAMDIDNDDITKKQQDDANSSSFFSGKRSAPTDGDEDEQNPNAKRRRVGGNLRPHPFG